MGRKDNEWFSLKLRPCPDSICLNRLQHSSGSRIVRVYDHAFRRVPKIIARRVCTSRISDKLKLLGSFSHSRQGFYTENG